MTYHGVIFETPVNRGYFYRGIQKPLLIAVPSTAVIENRG
jgi:hypothetical protein